jgi:hypothetical protein
MATPGITFAPEGHCARHSGWDTAGPTALADRIPVACAPGFLTDKPTRKPPGVDGTTQPAKRRVLMGRRNPRNAGTLMEMPRNTRHRRAKLTHAGKPQALARGIRPAPALITAAPRAKRGRSSFLPQMAGIAIGGREKSCVPFCLGEPLQPPPVSHARGPPTDWGRARASAR